MGFGEWGTDYTDPEAVMRSLVSIVFASGFAFLLFGTGQASGAGDWRDLPSAEHLPVFCNPKRDPQIAEKWNESRIPGLVWMNHYCQSMARLPGCERASGEARRGCLEHQLGGFKYVEDHAPKNYAFRPLVLVDWGKVLAKLGRYREAMFKYEEAIVLKPNYTRAYVALAWAYWNLDQKQFAVDAINRGLGQSPDSVTLKRMLKEFSG